MEEEKENLAEKKRGIKAFPWISVLIIFIISVETALLVYTAIQKNMKGRELASVRQKLASISEKMSLVKSEKSNLEIEIMDVNQEKLNLQLQQQDLGKKLEESKAELERSKDDLGKKLGREKQISKYLRRRWENSTSNVFVLMKKVEDLHDSRKELEEKLKLAEQEKQELMLDLEGVPLKEVVVTDTAGASPEASPPLSGTILIANHEVEPPFVIINLGTVDGVSIGDRFAVMKKKKKKRVGSITVSKLYRNMAVAEINRKTTRKKLKKNWKVVSE